MVLKERHPSRRSFTRLLPINLSRPDSAGLRVAYDCTHPCTEGSHSVFSFLRIQPHENYGPYAAPDSRMVELSLRCGTHLMAVMPVTVHNLRILPTSNEDRRPFPQLSPEILLLIGRYAATEPAKSKWRKQLLSVALICRSWAHLANLSFQLLDDCEDDGEKPSPFRMVRYLELQPRRAVLVRNFSPSHYKGFGRERKKPQALYRLGEQ